MPRTKGAINKPKLTWEQYSDKYKEGYKAKWGKWVIYDIFYDGLQIRGEIDKYRLSCKLPGIVAHLGHFPDIETAQVHAHRVFRHWIKEAGL